MTFGRHTREIEIFNWTFILHRTSKQVPYNVNVTLRCFFSIKLLPFYVVNYLHITNFAILPRRFWQLKLGSVLFLTTIFHLDMRYDSHFV